jgi:hypothetical protein
VRNYAATFWFAGADGISLAMSINPKKVKKVKPSALRGRC